MKLIVFEDDASRFVTGYGIHAEATSENSASVLAGAIRRHGRPATILTDNGKEFTSNAGPLDHNKPVAFEEEMMRNHVRHAHTRVRHPQTNGKVEKFWDIFERKVVYFKTVDEFMHWYNHIRPHGALNPDGMETPADAYYAKMITNEVLVDPAILWRNGS